jgi:hypothetical protein
LDVNGGIKATNLKLTGKAEITGNLKIGATGSSYSFPSTNGTDDQILQSTGVDGTLAWVDLPNPIEPKFSIGIDSTAINTTVNYPFGYSQGIIIDSVIVISPGISTQRVGVEVYYGSTISTGSGTCIFGASFLTTLNYYRTALRTGTITNATISKGNMIWLHFASITVKPRTIYVQIIGHRL